MDCLGVMIDNSRNGVMSVPATKRMIDLLEKMGYNAILLYIEDTYEVDNQPYFGHLRGRYSQAELKELDAYAKEHHMELIPCIQTLAHLNALMHWPQYRNMRDCQDILCAGEEAVYQLMEDIFATLDRCMTGRRINIGMDEAYFIGFGQYMKKHGLQDRMDILLNHLNRIASIAEKYHFELLMWGDMFFRLSAEGADYFTGRPDESLQKKIPANVKLIYWDYYSTEKERYDQRMEQHQAVQKDIWFAGGAWNWVGFAPHSTYAQKLSRMAFQSCVEHGVKNAFVTVWGDDGAECSRFSVLPTLYAVSRYVQGDFDEDSIKSGFEKLFGIAFDDFMNLELTDTPNTDGDLYNPEKYMLYNDCLMGAFDATVVPEDAQRYEACADRLCEFVNHAEFGRLFASAEKLCRAVAAKYTLGIRTREAYLSGDKEALRCLLSEYDAVRDKVNEFYTAYETWWMWENKPQGFEIMDVRLGGLMNRIRHCRDRIRRYLDGELDKIEELEEPVLDPDGKGQPQHKPTTAYFWDEITTVGTMADG